MLGTTSLHNRSHEQVIGHDGSYYSYEDGNKSSAVPRRLHSSETCSKMA